MNQSTGKKMCRRTNDKNGVHLRDKKGRFCKKSKSVKVVKAAKMKKGKSRSRSPRK
jgi:hypothetical protein